MSSSPRRVLVTSEGTSRGHFGPVEWGLLAATSLVWGSSYLWIAIGLDAFQPGVIAWLRLAFGAAVLVLLPRPKLRIARSDWKVILVIALAGNAGPALLFAMAEQTLESSVVGMLTAATPLATLAVALPLGNRSLRPVHGVGLALGLVGVLAMSIDNVAGASTGVSGIIYVLTAISGYAIVSNVIGPLVERYGAVGVVVRAQLIALAVMTPAGYAGLDDSSFLWSSFIAVAILGIFGTGIARSLQAALISRAGAPRASVVGYLVPVVAAVLGVVVRNEVLSPIELVGLVVISCGAFLGSRQIKPLG